MTNVAMRQRIAWMCTAAALGFLLGTGPEVNAGQTVYATADNGTTNLFGTLNLATGQFTEIATTTQLFGSLTTGTGGALYGGATDFNLYSISGSGTTSVFGTVTDQLRSFGFLGLASQGAAGFFADSVIATDSINGGFTAELEHIAADGNSSTYVGTMGASFGSFNSGNLAFAPNGNLYFDAWNTIASDVATLYQVNTTTGATTAVGSGLGSANPLTLGTVGTTLYGIDTFTPTSPVIYTIDTSTGVATAVGTVSGLPSGFTLDLISFSSVPEPSAITLFVTGVLGVLGLSRRRGQSRLLGRTPLATK